MSAFGRVSRDTLAYLKEIKGQLQSVDDEDERDILVQNVLEELAPQQLAVCCDRDGSLAVEALIGALGPHHLASFVESLDAQALGTMAVDSFGSRVLDKCLDRIGALAQREEEEGGEDSESGPLRRAMGHVTAAMTRDVHAVAADKCGSHVLRRLLSTAAGCDLERGRGGGAWKLEGAGAKRQQAPPFPECTMSVAKSVAALASRSPGEWTDRLAMHPYASPAIQALLYALEGDQDIVFLLVPSLLGSSALLPSGAGLKQAGQLLADLAADDVGRMAGEVAGSHLLEAVLAVCPAPLHSEFVARFVVGRAPRLARHPHANFVLQAALSSTPSQADLEAMLSELAGDFPHLLQHGRGGVVAAAVHASARLGAGCRAACEALRGALKEGHPKAAKRGVRALVPCLVLTGLVKDPEGVRAGLEAAGDRATDYEVERTKSQKRKGKPARAPEPRLSVLGCSILQGVLGMPYADCQPFADSMAAQPQEDLVTLAMDRGGCRCIEAFLSSGAGAKAKASVLSALKGSYAELAIRSGAGARTVERCFDAGAVADREAIAGELGDKEGVLSRLRWGPPLLRKCDVAGLRQSRDAWARNAERARETMAEYESLFGGAKETGGGEGGGAKGDKGGGGTKGGTREAVHRAMGVGGAVVDEVMAMLGFGGRARERREKGTQGQGADVDAAMEAVFARALKGEEGGEKRGKGRWGGARVHLHGGSAERGWCVAMIWASGLVSLLRRRKRRRGGDGQGEGEGGGGDGGGDGDMGGLLEVEEDVGGLAVGDAGEGEGRKKGKKGKKRGDVVTVDGMGEAGGAGGGKKQRGREGEGKRGDAVEGEGEAGEGKVDYKKSKKREGKEKKAKRGAA